MKFQDPLSGVVPF